MEVRNTTWKPHISGSPTANLRARMKLDILIAQPTPANLGHPSLLGRDIINNWFMQYDPVNDSLEFTVRRSGISYDRLNQEFLD